MTSQHDDEVLQDLWNLDEVQGGAIDEDCSPTKVCRNAREFTFEGIAEEEGVDLATAWRSLLQREGKLADSGDSVRDLVLGGSADGREV